MNDKHCLFHIGIPKSGTTTVQKTLDNDDRIEVTRSRYFTSKDWWLEKYPAFQTAALIIESNETLVSGGFQKVKFIEVVRRMHSVNPEAKVLITIREQHKALLSMFKYHIKYGHKGTRSLTHWLQETDLGMDYLSLVMFESIVKALMAYFPKDQIHVLFFEELRDDPKQFYEKLYKILGINFRESDMQKASLNVMSYNEKELYALNRLNSRSFRKDSWLQKVDVRLKRKLATWLPMKPKSDFFDLRAIDGYQQISEEFKNSNRFLVDEGFVSKEELVRYNYTI